ncbi:MAG: PKD domain-containing protein [Bacteroidota bacterium]
MKKITTILLSFILSLTALYSQAFRDDFENYKVGDYVGDVSSDWTTWSGTTGGTEDVQIVDNDAYSGTQSIYYDSPFGNGPQDLVLDFGGVHNTGKFRFTSMFKIPKGNAAYFNFQGGASIGSSWAMDFYFSDNGSWSVAKLSGTYPQDQWFEVKIEIDFGANKWDVYIDGVFQGSFSSGVNAASYLDIFGVDPNSSFWVDDVTYCINNSCNTDIAMDALSINANPICSNHGVDVTLDLTNYGPDPAKGFVLGLDLDGQGRIKYNVVLNDLAVGSDTSITISNLFKTNITGTKLQVRAINSDHDLNIANDTAFTTIDVYPSPDGSTVIKSSLFQGRFNVGNESQPDVIEVGKTNTYEFTPPKGYSNSNYPTTWNVSSIVAKTSYGVTIPGSDYTIVYPTSGSNGSIAFKGLSKYLDSNITFSITVVNSPNGCDSTVKRTVRVVPTPKTNFTFPTAICLGDQTEFINKTTIHSGDASYKWYFGDNDSSDNTNPIHEYLVAGPYTVRLVATSFPYGIVKDTSVLVVVSDIPKVKYKVNNKCEGNAVTFQNSTSISTGTLTYDWDFGDGSAHSSATNPSHSYSAPGVFKVNLTATANGCKASLIKSAYTFPKPVANFTAPTSPVCANTAIPLTNTSTLLFGEQGAIWNFGDGSIGTTKNGLHAFATSGTYNVKLKSVSEFGCADSILKQVVIKETPQPDFVGDQYCGKIPTIFTNTTVETIPNPVYNWTFSDNFTSSMKNISRTWPYEGAFSATLKADYSNGCSGEITKDFIVSIQAKADFTVKDICSGETANFVNLTQGDKGNILYNWEFGNGSGTDASPKRLYNPATTTTYSVRLVAAYAQGCADTIIKTLTVSQAPTCDFSAKNLGFLKYQFTPSNSTYTKYEWLFGEGGTATNSLPSYQYLYNGNFKVKMIATNSAGCMCETTKTVSATSAVNSISTVPGLTIYPNPNNGMFTISTSANGGMKIEVFNLLGSKILSQTTSDNTININLGDVAKGIYMVKVTINGVTTTSKITVNN